MKGQALQLKYGQSKTVLRVDVASPFSSTAHALSRAADAPPWLGLVGQLEWTLGVAVLLVLAVLRSLSYLLPSSDSLWDAPELNALIPELCPALSEVEYGPTAAFGSHYPRPETYSRGKCICTPVHNFVLVSMQRSGSGWLESFTHSHPNIVFNGEIFLSSTRRTNFSMIEANLDTVFNLDFPTKKWTKSCTLAVGFKWMLNQGLLGYRQQSLEYFRRKHVSVIYLVRRNILRRWISILANDHDKEEKVLGVHKSHAKKFREAKKLRKYKPTLNINEMDAVLNKFKEMIDYGMNAFQGARLMIVYYEDLLKNHTIIADIEDFLGVPRLKLHAQPVKIHTKALSESIENFVDVASKLENTTFEELLYMD